MRMSFNSTSMFSKTHAEKHSIHCSKNLTWKLYMWHICTWNIKTIQAHVNIKTFSLKCRDCICRARNKMHHATKDRGNGCNHNTAALQKVKLRTCISTILLLVSTCTFAYLCSALPFFMYMYIVCIHNVHLVLLSNRVYTIEVLFT